MKKFFIDLFERASSSAVQQALTVVLASGTTIVTILGMPWALILLTAATAFVVSIVTTVLQYMAGLTNLSFYPDLGLRVAKTFLASLLGFMTADGANVLNISWVHALDVATIAAVLALAKAYLARGATGTASLAVPAPTGGDGPKVK